MAELSRSDRIQGWLFLLVGAGLVAGVVALLAGFGKDERAKTYSVVFDETVAGIAARTEVMFQGVSCGEVTDVRLVSNPRGKVLVTIEVAPWTPVTRSTTASIAMQSIVGRFHIELTDAGEVRGDPAPDGFSIRGESSMIAGLSSAGEGLAERGLALLDNLTQLTDADNRERIERLLDDADDTVRKTLQALARLEAPATEVMHEARDLAREALGFLRDERPHIETLLRNAEAVSGSLRTLLEDPAISRLPGRLEHELTETASAARDATLALGRWLDQNAITPELDRAIGALNTLVQRADTLATTFEKEGITLVRAELVPTTRRLRASLVSLDRLLRGLDRDPSAILFGGPAAERPLPGQGRPAPGGGGPR